MLPTGPDQPSMNALTRPDLSRILTSTCPVLHALRQGSVSDHWRAIPTVTPQRQVKGSVSNNDIR